MRPIHLSIVTPAYKSAQCIPEMHRRLSLILPQITADYEILFVEDGSPQADWKEIERLAADDPRVRGIKLSRNYGQHYALTAGLDHARGDWVVVMDCDLQDQPEEIPKLYRKAREGWPIVLARRHARQDSAYRCFVSWVFARVYGWLGGIEVDNTIANFSICSRAVIRSVCRFRERNRSFPMFLAEVGFPRTTVDVAHAERFAGRSSYSLGRLLDFAAQAIIARSNKPLRLSILFGACLALASMSYGAFLLLRYFSIGSAVEGWTSLAVLISLFNGLLFANLGILGLYLGKVFNETKHRPLYIIERSSNLEVDKNGFIEARASPSLLPNGEHSSISPH